MSRLPLILLTATLASVFAGLHIASTPPDESVGRFHDGLCDAVLDGDSDCESHAVVGPHGSLPPDPLLASVVSTHHHHHARSHGVRRFDGDWSLNPVASIDVPSTSSGDARSYPPVTVHAVNRPRRL